MRTSGSRPAPPQTHGVFRDAGGVDIVFNAIGPLAHEYGGCRNAVDLTVEEFMVPLDKLVRSQFITAMAAARHMRQQGSQDVTGAMAGGMNVSHEQAEQFLASATMLHVSPHTTDTAKVAAFLASDSARTITGTQVMSEIR